MKEKDGLTNYYMVNLQGPLQIVDDWNREWITDIKVIESGDCKDLNLTIDGSEWVKIFSDPWLSYVNCWTWGSSGCYV